MVEFSKLVKRKCNFCNTEIEVSFRNHGLKHEGGKIWLCDSCISIDKECPECGVEFKTSFRNKDKNVFCSQLCSRRSAIKIMQKNSNSPKAMKLRHENMKKNNKGVYNKEFQDNIQKTLKERGTGLYDPKIRALSRTPEACAKREKTMIANGEAEKRNKRLWSKETIAKRVKTCKENSIGVFNREHQIKASKEAMKAQKRDKSGIFDPEIRKENQRIMKEKRIGIYDPENSLKGLETQKENNIGFYNQNFASNMAKKSIKAQKEKHIGIVGMWEAYKEGTASEEQIKLRDQIINNLSKVFDRDEFYSSDLNLVSFKVNGDSDQNMSLSKFVNKYNKVGSVIARNLYSSDGCFICCLDVAKTNGTSGELSWFQRTMKKAKEQKNLSTEELSMLSNPSIRLKRRKYLDEMDKYPNSKIVSEVVFAFDHPVEVGSEEEKYLLDIEMQYAHDNKALFWNN